MACVGAFQWPFSNVQEKKFIWPDDLKIVNFKLKQKEIIELLIQKIRQVNEAFLSSNNGMNFLKYKKRTQRFIVKRRNRTCSYQFPRSVVIFKDSSFVNLTGVEPLRGGNQQPLLKRVYNPDKGQWFLKKICFSTVQETLANFIWISNDISPQVRNGLSEIPYFERGKRGCTYYEKEYPGTVASLYRSTKNIPFHFDALTDLNLALHTIHSLIYSPPTLSMPSIQFSTMPSAFCYHGDISPNNVVYELENPSQDGGTIISRLRFGDLGAAAEPKKIYFTPGWNSPEGTQFVCSSHTDDEIASFNFKYGRKKDAWAFGLLAASLVNGGFIYPPSTQVTLPNLSFIYSKIQFMRDGHPDDSEIADLTQEEVDAALAETVSQIDQSTEIGKKLAHWWKTIGSWLQVDPEKRSDLKDCFL
jgi:hypothetical protein